MFRWLAIATTAAAFAGVDSAHAAGGLKVVVILDNSTSMNAPMAGAGTRIEAAKQALLTVLGQTPAEAEVGVVLLNRTPNGRWLVPFGPVDKQAVAAAVNALRADGPTPLGAAMKVAADQLLAARDRQRYGDYKLLIVSDGEASDRALVERLLPEIQARGLLIDVIGVSMNAEHSLATRSNTYRNASDPASLRRAISAVVLGESTADGAAAGDSDFELLEALPGEMAAAALGALTERRNTPIDPDAARRPLRGGSSKPKNPSPNAPGPAPDRDGLPFATIIALALIVIALRVVTSAMKGK